MLRVAVIGCGSIGRRHIENLIDLGCDVVPFDKAPDAPPVMRADNWSPGDFDAVVVATPSHQHLDYAAKSIKRRVPVVIEKPLGTVEQIEAWRALAADAAGLTTMVGYNFRFHQRYLAMRASVPQPTSGSLTLHCDMQTWPGSAKDGDPLLECSHEIDLALSLGAPPVVTEVRPSTYGPGWLLRLGAWRLAVRYREPKYHLEWDITNDRGSRHVEPFSHPDDVGKLMYRDEMQHFIECVREKRPTDCPLSDGVRVLDVIAQMERMVKEAA